MVRRGRAAPHVALRRGQVPTSALPLRGWRSRSSAAAAPPSSARPRAPRARPILQAPADGGAAG
eukprot:1685296-Alexandrium_andersonii.AAC.1